MFLVINNYKTPYKKYFKPLENFLINYSSNNKSFHYIILSNHKDFDNFIKSNKQKFNNIQGLIISGSHYSVIDTSFQDFSFNLRIINYCLNICPIFTICFGTQLISSIFGSQIKKMNNKISGDFTTNIITNDYQLFNNLNTTKIKKNNTFLTNYNFNDRILNTPFSFKNTTYFIHNNKKIITGFFEPIKSIHCVLFHPEKNTETHPIIINFINLCLKLNHNI